MILENTEGDPDKLEVSTQKRWTKRWKAMKTNRILIACIYFHFQKPSHKIFYNKIIKTWDPAPDGVTWDNCDTKMRNLKNIYSQTVDWLKNTGSGLKEDEQFKSIEGEFVHNVFVVKQPVELLIGHFFECCRLCSQEIASSRHS